MRRAQGYITLTSPDAPLVEWDTFTCAHCQRIVKVPPRADPADLGGLCKVCNGLICRGCVGKPCKPWEKKMQEMEARERFRRSV